MVVAERRLPGSLNLTVERDVPARMRDGTLLYADIYRPTTGGPFPVILMRLPYDKSQAENLTYHHPAWYARHGYLVVVQDTRGRWRSEGDFYPFAHEAEDGADSVEWAASLPQSSGRVGMYGFSYVGATQLQAAPGSAAERAGSRAPRARRTRGWPRRACSTRGATLPVSPCRSWSAGRRASRSAGALRVPAARVMTWPLSVPCRWGRPAWSLSRLTRRAWRVCQVTEPGLGGETGPSRGAAPCGPCFGSSAQLPLARGLIPGSAAALDKARQLLPYGWDPSLGRGRSSAPGGRATPRPRWTLARRAFALADGRPDTHPGPAHYRLARCVGASDPARPRSPRPPPDQMRTSAERPRRRKACPCPERGKPDASPRRCCRLTPSGAPWAA